MYRAVAVAEQLSGLDMQAHQNTKSRVRAPLLRALEEAMEKDFADKGGL